MSKARLIKKQEVDENKDKAIKKRVLPQQKTVKKTVDSVVEWLESQRLQKQDPRKAFAALFVTPQTQ